jgi:fatty acyl-CoA reductase
MNTYVYTKNIAERYIARYRGNMRTVISRPSVVTGAYREPLIGWTDTVAAGGALLFPGMIGLERNMYLPDINICCVPVDLVCNGIIAASAAAAQTF